MDHYSRMDSGTGELKHKPVVEVTPLVPRVLLATHFFGVVMVILMLVWTLGPRGGLAWDLASYQGIYNWHPLLMLVGFIFLFGNSLLVYRTYPGSKYVKKIIHAVFNLLGFICAVVGVWFVWVYHDYTGDAHLTSLHAWLGFATVILFGLQWLGGLILYLVPATPVETRKAAMPIHVFVGLSLFFFVLLLSCLGILEKLTFLTDAGTITRRGTDTLLGNFLAITILIWGAHVFYTVLYTSRLVEVTPPLASSDGQKSVKSPA
eukprot:TRINITY_DN23772_c0_g1_i1.p1 TRINITY_DN23772_c0_g1~~TRINITY_DN23772_c0_g1_i1.p1  ORF type:complete len:262 (+),score=12.81 TRINITY_DN23772_c0_g1_i1:242-1027(+)